MRFFVFVLFIVFAVSLQAQLTDTLRLNFSKPFVFEKIHTPGRRIVIVEDGLELEEMGTGANVWFNNANVQGISSCRYMIEIKDSIVESVCLKSKSPEGMIQLKNLASDLCTNFQLKEGDRNVYNYCEIKIFNGVLCMICYSENRKKQSSILEINYTEDY